jgi:hypothetical protein
MGEEEERSGETIGVGDFLRFHVRIKDGKDHRYWGVVENRRCGGGKVVQRQVLYLGEINDSQHESWCPTIEED